MKRLIFDLDNTISFKGESYETSTVNLPLIRKLKEYKKQGFEIVISTSRNMRTFEGNLGKINKESLPIILRWLEDNDIDVDEVYIGKPWCGEDGFYVDDRAIRPDEFVELSYEDIVKLIT